jgi:dTDP-D-glucose 4,6-dehydratase
LILRPSSVYGFIDNRVKRPSLIPTIMHNALLNKLSTLYGNLYTLRNYIWVEDVANFVINKLIHFEDGMYILAGSRSYSIIEIKKEIERVVKKRVYFKLNSSKENNLDIVFANNILPLEYKNTTVAEGIHKIMQK